MNELRSNVLMAVISNITLEPYFLPQVSSVFIEEKVKVSLIPYNEYNGDEYRKDIMESKIIVIWLNFEQLFPDIFNSISLGAVTEKQFVEQAVIMCKKVFLDIKERSNAHFIWFLYEDYFMKSFITEGHGYDILIDKINLQYTGLLSGKATVIDVKRLIAEVGIEYAYNVSGKCRWNAPYSKKMISIAVGEIYKQYSIERGISKKCLVLDCDNVLWGGALSEDGIEKIKLGESGLGREYQDLQRFVLSLYSHGVILAICSKNDFIDVQTMFHEHSGMILKEEHIACFRVNWENKCDNIKQIANILNIGLGSIVFVDDSPIEIEAVKSLLPEVEAILYDRESMYEKFSCFSLKNMNIAEIIKRNKTYQTNLTREIMKTEYVYYKDYISALEIEVEIHEATPVEIARISELTQRTNKCTNGKRYTVSELKKRVSSKMVILYSLTVSDKLSNLGIVSAMEVEDNALTHFSLSCRAMGRECEIKMLQYLRIKHDIEKILFFPTGKNDSLKTLFNAYFPNAVLINKQ